MEDGGWSSSLGNGQWAGVAARSGSQDYRSGRAETQREPMLEPMLGRVGCINLCAAPSPCRSKHRGISADMDSGLSTSHIVVTK